MRPSYKHFLAITSQLPFCATPLRLDPYNRCQFGCGYCFASTRQGHGRKSELKAANPLSLDRRLDRVSKGIIQSALDEMLAQRIPIQVGGMADPFTHLEEKEGNALQIIKVLAYYNYPFIISTKSDLLQTNEYFDALVGANVYVRFSTTVIDPKKKPFVDVGTKPVENLYECIRRLSDAGVPCALRFQPIIPGHEQYTEELVEFANRAGVRHISAEYLKVPIDADRKFSFALKTLLGGKAIKNYQGLGAIKLGREYVLPLEYRQPFLIKFAQMARNNDITFGFADNDLLLHSDGASCCSAADLYLKDASFFQANTVALFRNKPFHKRVTFDEFVKMWCPKSSISPYLNSTARVTNSGDMDNDWQIYLEKMWCGEHGVYSPDFFDGIERVYGEDSKGRPIFARVASEFEAALAEKATI